MEKDLLHAVIRVESEIQHSIETEKKKAADWLESVRVSLSRELEAKKQQLDEEYSESLATTSRQCELQATKEIAEVDKMASHLQNLPEEYLLDAVKGFIQEILPKESR